MHLPEFHNRNFVSVGLTWVLESIFLMNMHVILMQVIHTLTMTYRGLITRSNDSL